MTLNQLEYFCAVCRYHSIARASEELFVSSPTISVAIRDLEKEFNIGLFRHSRNKITLTDTGEAFYKKAEELLKHNQDMYTEFAQLGQQIQPLKLGIPPMLSTMFFPEMIDAFHREYDIPVHLFEYGSYRSQAMIQNGELDLALVNMDFYNNDLFNSYILMEDSYVYCVSRTHPLAQKKEITLDQLIDEQLIFYNTDSVQNQTFQTRFRSLGIQPNVIMYCSQLYTILNYIAGGKCGAFLFSTMDIDTDKFCKIAIVPKISNPFGIIWNKNSYIPLRTSRFIDFLKHYNPRNL